jgi:hypothetical protein
MNIGLNVSPVGLLREGGGDDFSITLNNFGGMMISNNCSFSDFVATIKDKSYDDIIYLADQEATAAERLLYRRVAADDLKKICGQEYASILKDFIAFMRCDIRPKKSKNELFELFELVLDNVNSKEKDK